MDESAALDVVAVRAVELRDHARTAWTDADRAWASRAAAEAVGEHADAGDFVARRAELALERLCARSTAFARALPALRWRPWVGWTLVAAAFVVGAAVDRIGGAERINLLAPPVFALLAWNLAVYAVLAGGYIIRYGDVAAPGPLRRLLIRAAVPRGRAPRAGRDDDDVIAKSLPALALDWAQRAAPLYRARATRILHLAAAALALGMLAGMYVRGLAFEYRASWESTFLDADAVRALLAAALAPGALVTGIAVPDAAHVAAIRVPASENAAMWLHLLAGTVLVLVVLPRLALAAVAGTVERHRAKHVAVGLDEPYCQRLLRGFREGPVPVRAVPYSYALTPEARAGLGSIIERVFGGGATLAVDPPLAYGADAAPSADALADAAGPVIVLFGLTATPEPEVHGAFVAAALERLDPAQPLLAIVDESAFRRRWPNDRRRLAERRGLWSTTLTAQRVAPIFVDLAAPDLAFAEGAIDAALVAREGHAVVA